MSPRRWPSLRWLWALLPLCLFASPSYALWNSRGNVVDDDNSFSEVGFDNLNHGHSVCPGDDGALITAYVGPGGEIRVNKLNAETGAREWGLEGTEVNIGGLAAEPPHIVSDSTGGCWVVWLDTRVAAPGPGLYFQRYDATGAALFAAGGIRFSTSTSATSDQSLDIAVTEAGRLLMAYWEADGLHVQRVLPTGVLQFGADGSLMTTDPGQRPVRIVANNEGGLVVWHSLRAGLAGTSSLIGNSFLQGSGAPLWGAEGSVIFSAAAVVATLGDVDWDGTNLFVSWFHDPATANQIRAQKVDIDGNVQWGTTATGVVAMTQQDTPFDNGNMRDVRLARDGAGGCILAWVDARHFNQPGAGGFIHNTDLYGQRLNNLGAAQWTAQGTAVDSTLGTQEDLRIVADGAGGIFLAYTDLNASFDANGDDASAARVNAAGTRQWKNIITDDFPNDTQQFEPMLDVDGFGGLLVVWTDERTEFNNGDVFGIRLAGGNGGIFTPQLTVSAPNGGETFVTPDSIRVGWTSNIAGNVKIEYAVTGQARLTIVASTPNDGAFDWTTNALVEGTVKIFVSDAADGSPVDSSNAAFTMCPVLDSVMVTAGDAPNAGGMVAADFNEDGILDLAMGGVGGVRIRLGLGAAGVGNGTYGASSLLGAGADVQALAVGDLNEDGRLDLVGVTAAGMFRALGGGAGTIGNGTFGAPAFFNTGGRPLAIALADFNEDGVLDAIVANDSSGTVSRLPGTGTNGVGTGSFATKADFAVQSGPRALAVEDLNGDDILDVVVANSGSSSVSVLMGNGAYGIGNGTFTAAVHFATGAGPGAVTLANLDGDATPDLVVGHQGPAVTSYRLTFPGGVPALAANPTTSIGGANTVTGIVARDVNRDGRMDVAITESSTNLVFLFHGRPAGDGSFRFGGTLTGTSGRAMIAALDPNEDANADLVVAQQGPGTILVFRAATCGLALDAGLSWVDPAAAECLLPGSLQGFQWTRGAGVAAVHVELSRDGGANWERLRSNLAVANRMSWRVTLPTAAGTARLRVLDAHNHNNGGQSAPGFSIRSGLDTPVVYALPDTGRDAVIEDFDEDGISDLAVAHRDGVRILRGLGAAGVGNGTFSVFADLPTVNPASQVAAADLDDDGILDLVIGTDTGYEVRRGQGAAGVGDGTFGGASVRELGHVTRDLALGDFNEDGIPDLALAPRDSAFILVALGQGANGLGLAAFGIPTRFTLPGNPRALEIADANEDGVQDLLVVNGDVTGNLTWLRGQSVATRGNGAFHAPVNSASLAEPFSMAVLDLNGDHILDVIVGTENASLQIHLGTGAAGVGNGSFTVTGEFKAYESDETVSAIAVAPLDGIARPAGSPSRDLAIVSEDDDDNEHWWLVCRDSTGPDNVAFAHATGFAFGKSEGLVLGDFNEDGYEDVALWSATAAQLRVALGNCSDPKDTFTSASFLNVPNGGQVYAVNSNQSLTFDTADHLWDLDVTRDNGANWEPVARKVAATSFSWTVTGPNTGNARIRLRRSLAPGSPVVDQSDAVFTIGSSTVDAPGVAPPDAVAFSPAWPNPSRGSVRFDLALPQAAAIELDIFDAQGRRVASLAGRDFPAGRHTITWEGRAMNGVPVAAGVYFAHLRTPGFEAARRIVRIP